MLVMSASGSVLVFRDQLAAMPGLDTLLLLHTSLLIGPAGRAVNAIGALALIVLCASTCWAFGSWVQPRLALPRDALVMIVHQMWIGGLVLLLVGTPGGERLAFASFSGRTWVAWGYLVEFG